MTAISPTKVLALAEKGMTAAEIAASLMTSFQSVKAILDSRPASSEAPVPGSILSARGKATRHGPRGGRSPEPPARPAPPPTSPPVAKPLRRFTEHFELDPASVLPLGESHAAVRGARTVFPSTVAEPMQVDRVLVSGMNSRKIGDRVIKGAWAGMPIYTLTLEERATCPSSCALWRSCYGNAMHLARRHRHGTALEMALEMELAALAARHPRGFVVRLHVLGDFYSVDYVTAWAMWMLRFEALHVFGYTAWDRDSDIGDAVLSLGIAYPDRWAIRFSGAEPAPMGTVTIARVPEGPRVAEGIVCPAQTGASECCGTCGLCWAEAAKDKTIVFVLHGRKPRGAKKADTPRGDKRAASKAEAPPKHAGEVSRELGCGKAPLARSSAATVPPSAPVAEESPPSSATTLSATPAGGARDGEQPAKPAGEPGHQDVDALVERAFRRVRPGSGIAPSSPWDTRRRGGPAPVPTPAGEPGHQDVFLGQALSAAITRKAGEDRGAKEPKGCRWITGDVRSGDWSYCQAKTNGESSYCAHHHEKSLSGKAVSLRDLYRLGGRTR